ncbi:MAG: class I SAM-dependent methyltransferase [Gammaproteobacteria bacterium]|jgi:predicted methyltransferase|nr:class I SAM-dependent methyltransferase [Gammaproteobacteria bacterium]MBT5217349.1 class I SAM-dependent methyltransferase [Gammaproteobacteria bacterium]MBT5542359.1 class I SAM-dependent methyltransferase [Gammaproteobacteria bacterium]MBT6074468.1 class I SAM-dependent methyltransferase [Gammaproteobacteria bacterium]MBT7753507.1 class I SAM-dependent methyltransferase [Gammaproteobacteria bacterium]
MLSYISKSVYFAILFFQFIFPTTVTVAQSLDEIISGEHRSDQNKIRNEARHPKETLEFFGLEKTMTVVEVWPSAGWYTEVIAPYLNDSGQYISASFDVNTDNEYFGKMAKRFQNKLDEYPDLYGNVKHGVLEAPDRIEIAETNSVDMVLTFRNIHNWMARGQTEMMFKGFYKVLKPGGILGVVEHRGNSSITQDPKAKSGYVNQEFAIALAEQSGFIFEESSEINANPKDNKEHREGVWTLAPTYRNLSDDEKADYKSIGESDRFTLRFRKPE